MEMIGNDTVALIKNYKSEILKSRTSNSTEQERIYVEILLASLPICIFTSLYPVFKDQKIGRELFRSFMSEFEYLIKTDEIGDVLQSMIRELKIGSVNQIIEKYPLFYIENIRKAIDSEEKVWVKNYSNAILNQFINYSKAAINHGFI